ncbi:MAG: hypothetical protein WCI11_15800 [Candidatus Methylumidiphilus sp.]
MHTIQFDAHNEAALTQLAAMAGKDSDQLIKDVVSEYLAEQADKNQADAAKNLSAITGLWMVNSAWDKCRSSLIFCKPQGSRYA